MVDTTVRVAAKAQLPRIDTRIDTRRTCGETEAGAAEGRRCEAPGESAPVKLLAA